MKQIKILATVLLAVLLLYLFFKDENLQQVIHVMARIPPIYPLLFIAGTIIQLFIRGYRWGLLIKPYKTDIPITTLYNFTLIGYFINLFVPGRVGEAAKGILIARDQAFKSSQGLASVVLERMIDVFMTLLLFLISFAFTVKAPSPVLTSLQRIALYLLPFMVIIFLLFYLVNSRTVLPKIISFIRWFSDRLPRRWRERAQTSILNFIQALRLKLSVSDMIKLFIASLMVWLWIIPFFWILMMGFEIDISLPQTIPYYCILVMSAAVPTPGMAGSLDAGSKLGLVELYNVPGETAVAYTLFTHFLILIIWGAFGFLALSMQQIKLKTIQTLRKKQT